MKKYLLPLLGFLLITSLSADAQRWRRQRYEFSIGGGVSNFLGELGGANQIGTNYFKDLEWSQTRMALAIGLRYKLTDYFALNTHLTYGRVSGDDKLTKEPFRSYRNLNFFSDIYEVNVNFEGAVQKEQVGHRYRLRNVRGLSGYELYTYGFVGIGVFHYDPMTEYQGQVIQLRPLGTEGQGQIETRKTYSTFGVCIPAGIGFKYTIDRYWGVGIEIGLRKTFTDYIDDVSTTYYDFADPNSLSAQLGNRSNPLTVPSGEEYVIPSTQPGQQRGDPRDNDSYMFGIFSINYKIITGTGRRARF
ncbi:MAG: hypothetical protein RL213_797 [Bacteroidota bacterium]|jgi:hypothetical protein